MSNWWSKKLSGGSSTPRAEPTPPRSTSPASPAQSEPTSNPSPHYRRPPQSSLAEDVCPGCGSMNYMAPPGTQAKRCFDCGYPIQQSGSGVGGVGTTQTDGSVKKATQPKSGGYHPTQIIGKVE